MASNSIKSKAREYYRKHKKVTLKELQDIFFEVNPATINKYLIEFRKLYVNDSDIPDKISVSKSARSPSCLEGRTSRTRPHSRLTPQQKMNQ